MGDSQEEECDTLEEGWISLRRVGDPGEGVGDFDGGLGDSRGGMEECRGGVRDNGGWV